MTEDCGVCNHSQAYHDIPSGCRAWNPDEADNFCACKGWEAPVRRPVLVSVDAAGTEWYEP